MKSKYLRKYPPVIGIVLLLIILLIWWQSFKFLTPKDPRASSIILDIPCGSSFKSVTKLLAGQGLLKDPMGFYWIGRLRGWDKKIKCGEYELTAAKSGASIIQKLISGDVVTHLITIPEGFNARDIAARLEEEDITEPEAFIEEAGKRFRLFVPFEVPVEKNENNPEGFLFPDTYRFVKNMAPGNVANTMLGRFAVEWSEDFNTKAKELGLTPYEVVILASLIEKETSVSGERRLISSVYHNRLKRGMRLQCDPTVIYGIMQEREFDGNLTKADLLTPSQYNTYLNSGLPPTPIANPGKASIDAALNPAKTKYLYFVSKNDGTHQFSETLVQHNQAVRKYQQVSPGN